jgi:hypothetical protein
MFGATSTVEYVALSDNVKLYTEQHAEEHVTKAIAEAMSGAADRDLGLRLPRTKPGPLGSWRPAPVETRLWAREGLVRQRPGCNSRTASAHVQVAIGRN